ncbi:MAG: hypothetical protein LBD45_09665 [Bacteroidales bacterium]|jgi:hypothetical protein|nr:hypothetical protein [Bacteroidales bacterium]
MIRTVFIPEAEEFVFSIPKEYVGKKVEVIAFVVDETNQNLHAKEVTFTDFGLNLPKDWKFDREEANAR